MKNKNSKFELNNKQIESFISQNTAPSWSSANYDTNDYAQAGIEVVLETLYDDSRNHLTEKTLRPIACGKPFMLASTPYSLSYLRDYGFKTFDGLIDESYHTITDPLQRLHAVVKEMQRISNLDLQEKILLWTQLYEIADYNKQHFFSDKFHTFVVDEFVSNFRVAYKECLEHRHKTYYYLFKNCNDLQESDRFKEIINYIDSYSE